MLQVLWWLLAAATLLGAASVILAREVMRLLLGLGAFLLGLAGLYAMYGFGLLAVAQLFLYVGGVLVLFLFAIATLGRDEEGRALGRPFGPGAFLASASLVLVLVAALGPTPATFDAPAAMRGLPATLDATGAALLGPLVSHFEVVGVLLLAALAAALAIAQGREE
jgi:NADH:ubiquinone oxidoreductase subunit 6 (subunit J)